VLTLRLLLTYIYLLLPSHTKHLKPKAKTHTQKQANLKEVKK
jgi:hypothetical protein